MILAQAPCRISLAGGGTDLPMFATKYGGQVISLAINIRQYFRLNDKKGKCVVPADCSYNFVKAFLKEDVGFESWSDGGIRGGLGSSAAIAVAITAAIFKSKGITKDQTEIAEKAWDIEVNKLKMFGGKQDQYAASYGGVNVFEFTDTVAVNKYHDIEKPPILLFDTGIVRSDPKIQEMMQELTSTQIGALKRIKGLVDPMEVALWQQDIKNIGDVLKAAWDYKKESNAVSNPQIDKIYELGLKNGALGGKLCGSGGGGFMIFVVPWEKQKKFIEKMPLVHWDYDIDRQGVDVRVLP